MAAADAACLAVFVLLGRQSHDLNSGFTWYLTVLWPFLLGWFAAAAALRLYATWPNRLLALGAKRFGLLLLGFVLQEELPLLRRHRGLLVCE